MSLTKLSRRRAKKGFVYLLKGSGGYYKYGCSKNLKEAVRKVNYSNPFKSRFILIKSTPSKDIYKSKCQFKWFLWSNATGGSEFFETDLSENNLCQKLQEVTL